MMYKMRGVEAEDDVDPAERKVKVGGKEVLLRKLTGGQVAAAL